MPPPDGDGISSHNALTRLELLDCSDMAFSLACLLYL